MENETIGTVVSARKQWWLKVNTKPVRLHSLDGATFPYIIKVKYVVDGNEYICRKWIRAGRRVPVEGSELKVVYRSDKPSKAKVVI